MKIKTLVAALLIAAFAATSAPAPRALADGAASTRNILLGGAAATLLIINHNKKVHERYAEDAQKQAALASQRDDAWSAYHSEQKAYANKSALVAELQKEVNYQHNVVAQLQKQNASQRGLIDQQNRQLAQLGVRVDTQTAALNARPAQATAATTQTQRGGVAAKVAHATPAVPNDIVAYGWGTL